MRQQFFLGFGLLAVVTFLGLASTQGQEPADLVAVRKQRAELEQDLKKKQKDFDEATLKQRAESEQKLNNLEREARDAFNKQHAELAKKLMDFKQQEASIQSKIEAKEKGFYARLEVKGRLQLSNGSDSFPPMPRFRAFWTVTVGDVRYELIFGDKPSRNEFHKFAEERDGKGVLISGEAMSHYRLAVKSFEAVKD